MGSDTKEVAGLIIQNGTIDDHGAIQQMCDERYGPGYVTRQTVEQWMRCPELFLVAKCDGRFAGLSVMTPHTPQEVAQRMDMPLSDVLRFTGDKPPLVYRTGAIEKMYEGRGIMSALAAQGLERARRMGFGALFTSAWTYGGTIPAEGTLRRYGCEPLYKRSMLWYHMEDYTCVVCKGRCRCDSVIFAKKI